MSELIKVFAPNGIKTIEECPICGDDAMVEHGQMMVINLTDAIVEKIKTRIIQHYWHCHTCGEKLVTVDYCLNCLKEATK